MGSTCGVPSYGRRYNTDLKLPRLAQACRQLHQETSLLLYQLNLLSFGSIKAFGKWMESLTPLQLRAVRNFCPPASMDNLPWARDEELSGLRERFCWKQAAKLVEQEAYAASGKLVKRISIPLESMHETVVNLNLEANSPDGSLAGEAHHYRWRAVLLSGFRPCKVVRESSGRDDGVLLDYCIVSWYTRTPVPERRTIQEPALRRSTSCSKGLFSFSQCPRLRPALPSM